MENKTHGLGEETVFDFKYIPNFSTTTELGKYEASKLQETSIERRNLRALIIANEFLEHDLEKALGSPSTAHNGNIGFRRVSSLEEQTS